MTRAEASQPRRIVTLQEPPSLGKLYAKAGGSTALGAVGLLKRARSFPALEYRLNGLRADRRKLRDFNRLMHGSDRDELPSGFVHTMAFPTSIALMSDDSFPLPLIGSVHLANSVQHYRRIDPAETLAVRVWSQNPAQHRAGTQVEIVAELSSEQSGEVLWHSVSTYLSRGIRIAGLLPLDEPERPTFQAPDANALWSLPGNIGRRYAAVSGDVNPIHMSGLTAKALGMNRAIAHGMYLASKALTGALPAATEAFRWEARFATPTFIPGAVAVRFDEVEGQVSYQGWNPRNGKPHFSGTVEALS
ncbi:MaoC family dehydratase [Psychromicrobium sp. YIM B11713]|uniref:MaoC family dehydratase n=1 Tax=Psychromicrobium sp. YIM B11713 TaxID=3145233 RepID=UPI00374EA961